MGTYIKKKCSRKRRENTYKKNIEIEIELYPAFENKEEYENWKSDLPIEVTGALEEKLENVTFAI